MIRQSCWRTLSKDFKEKVLNTNTFFGKNVLITCGLQTPVVDKVVITPLWIFHILFKSMIHVLKIREYVILYCFMKDL